MAVGRLRTAAEPAHHWRWLLLRARPERPDRHAAEHRDELAPLQLIESRPAPNEAKAGLQNIELAQISQEVVERFCNESSALVNAQCREANITKSGVRLGVSF